MANLGKTVEPDVTLAGKVNRVGSLIIAGVAMAFGVTFAVTLFTLPDTPSRYVATIASFAVVVVFVVVSRDNVVVSPGARVVRVRNPFHTVVVPFSTIAGVTIKTKRHRASQTSGSYRTYQVRLQRHHGRDIKCRGLGYDSYGSTQGNAERIRGLVTAHTS